MGASKSKLEKIKKLSKQDKQDCITKAIKIILSNEKKNYKNYSDLHDFLKLESRLYSSSDDLTNNSYSTEKCHDNQSDLSHDSIASSFIFTSANSLNKMASANIRPIQFTPQTLRILYSSLNRPFNQSKHLRVYHDIYFF